LLVIGHVLGGREQVALAAPRVDQAARGAGIELGAEPLDIDIDDVRKGIEVLVPDVLGDLFPAYHAALIEDEEFQERIFLGGEADGASSAHHGVAGGIHRQIAHLDHGRAENGGTPQQGAEASEELLEVERLGQVIVGSAVEAGHAVVHAAAGGEHQDGDARAAAAQLPAHGMAVLQGQHDIEDDQVVLVDGGKVHGLLAVAGQVHGVGLFAQAFSQETGDAGVVLDKENPHVPIVQGLGTSVEDERRPEGRRRGSPERVRRPESPGPTPAGRPGVALYNQIMPFEGMRVLSLESRRAAEMAELIRRQGGEPFVAPSMREVPLDENREAFSFGEELFGGGFDMTILLTGIGTRQLNRVLATRYPATAFAEALRRVTVVARGPKPAAALREMDVSPNLSAPEPHTWREVLAVTEGRPERRIAVQEYGRSNPELLDGLRARGAGVTAVRVYQWDLPENIEPLRESARRLASGDFAMALFTTAVQIVHLMRVAEDLGIRPQVLEGLRRTLIGSIGPTTTEALEEFGLKPAFEPSHPKMGILVREAAERARQ